AMDLRPGRTSGALREQTAAGIVPAEQHRGSRRRMTPQRTALMPQPTAGASQARFVFHGLAIVIESDSAQMLDEVGRDFYYFRSAAGAHAEFHIEGHATAPRYEEFPALTAAFVTPRNVC